MSAVCGRRLTAGRGWSRLILPVRRPSREATTPPRRALVEAERHQLPLVVASDQRIIGLVGDVARIAVFVGDGERLHQVPAGEVRDADIPDLAGAHQHIERRQHLFGRREGIEAVELEQVDVIGAEPASAPSMAASKCWRDEPTSFGPSPKRNVALVEISTLSRRPLMAWPSTRSDSPAE